MKTKKRHLKLFNDKFPISSDKLERDTDLYNLISNATKNIDITHKNIKQILSNLNLYLGVFYIKPSDVNFNLLNLNLENVYQDTVKLNKQEHSDNDWSYDNDEFQKVFVLKFNGSHAIVALTYNDSWSPLIVDTIPTHNIYFEGNIAKSLLTL